jgi:hypothetical protein
MMVLRQPGPTSATVVRHEEMAQDEERPTIPIDLSNKHSSSSPEIPRHLSRSPYLSIIPTTIRPLLSPRTPPNFNNNNNTTVNNNNLNKSNSPRSVASGESSPSPRVESNSSNSIGSGSRSRRKPNHYHHHNDMASEMRWSGGGVPVEELNSSPDSGLHRDSPGEDEDLSFGKDPTPPLSLSTSIRKQPQSLIPLSIIRARYSHKLRAEEQEQMLNEEDNNVTSPNSGRPKDQVLTKRARLEEMVTHIKSSKDRSRRNSGDDDTSSGGHVTSSDEVAEDAPTDLRSGNSNFRHRLINPNKGPIINGSVLNFKRRNNNSELNEDDMMMEDEPCNLVCPKSNNVSINNNNNNVSNRSSMSRTDDEGFEAWKNANKPSANMKPDHSFSPAEAAKMLGIEPDAYQQQMMQFQLQSAAMLGDPGGLLKAMGPYPPLVYLGYYSQLLHSFQAQEILRQYAMQSNPATPNPGDKVSLFFCFNTYILLYYR